MKALLLGAALATGAGATGCIASSDINPPWNRLPPTIKVDAASASTSDDGALQALKDFLDGAGLDTTPPDASDAPEDGGGQ